MTVKPKKRAQSRPNLNRQSGAAAIWMGLTLVPIMGFTFWAVEGTRYVQETSRLRDAAEAAAIAVTIEDIENDSQAMAKRYVENYVRDIKSSSVTTTRFVQEQDLDNNQDEYTQYTVNATTTHDSWFASTFIPSFDKTQDLAGYSLARKYPAYLGDNNIDIVFVSDFSGSMGSEWGKGSNKSYKIDDLKAAIRKITEKVLCSDLDNCENDNAESSRLNNRIGFVPYNIRTRSKIGDEYHATSQLLYKTNHNPGISLHTYQDVDWNAWRRFSASTVQLCADSPWNCAPLRGGNWFACWFWGRNCPSETDYALAQTNQSIATRIDDVMSDQKYISNDQTWGTIPYGYPDAYDYVDYQQTVSSMLTNKVSFTKTSYKVVDSTLYQGFGDRDSVQFYNVSLTNDNSFLDEIDRMYEAGSTAVFQGILKGLEVLNAGAPQSDDLEEIDDYNAKVKMLLILSDGQESPQNGVFSKLADRDSYDMCGVARQKIPGLYIGVIGIGYNAEGETGFIDCVENLPKT